MKHSEKRTARRSWHKDWRTWAAIGLMLVAMGMYVLTLDDSTPPGGVYPSGSQPPAASGAAGR